MVLKVGSGCLIFEFIHKYSQQQCCSEPSHWSDCHLIHQILPPGNLSLLVGRNPCSPPSRRHSEMQLCEVLLPLDDLRYLATC